MRCNYGLNRHSRTWLTVLTPTALVLAAGAPAALARPHFQTWDSPRFDFQGLGVFSTFLNADPDTGGDIVIGDIVLFDLAPPGPSSQLPGPGILIVNPFDIGGSLTLTRDSGGTRMSMDSTRAEMSILGDSNNGPSTALRSYDIELISMSLTSIQLPPNWLLRESPTLASTGLYSTELPPDRIEATFLVDGFFDLFMELSTDGGNTWTPADAAMTMTLVPTPSSVALLAMGGVLVCRRRRS